MQMGHFVTPFSGQGGVQRVNLHDPRGLNDSMMK